MPRALIKMQKPIAAYVSKLLGWKFSHVSVSYHACEERTHRLPLTWDKGGFSWVYVDELERWARGYKKRREASGRAPKRKGKATRARKATSRR